MGEIIDAFNDGKRFMHPILLIAIIASLIIGFIIGVSVSDSFNDKQFVSIQSRLISANFCPCHSVDVNGHPEYYMEIAFQNWSEPWRFFFLSQDEAEHQWSVCQEYINQTVFFIFYRLADHSTDFNYFYSISPVSSVSQVD